MEVMRKPKNCWCKGTRKVKSLRWGCLKRDANGSLLYCKDCRHEWLSVRKYAAAIPMWVKEVRSGMTDQDILDRIAAGSLRVREENGAVIVESDSHKGTAILKQTEHAVHEYTSYRFVNVTSGGRKRKIAVHRLNWIFHNGAVPDGLHVDHKNGRGDVISNLQLLTPAVNCNTNGGPKFDPDQGEMF